MSAGSRDDGLEFRRALESLEQRAQHAFDTTIIALAGGALGLSFAFLKDILAGSPPVRPTLILVAWLAWVVALASILTSHYMSVLAMRSGIRDLDLRGPESRYTGGWADRVTAVLNGVALVAVVVGMVFAGIFLTSNFAR